MALLAITVLGHDRPGIIADVTKVLARRDANVEDSSMTLLRGHFAWTLVVGTDTSAEVVAAELAFLESDDLMVSVLPVTDEQLAPPAQARPFVISVHGADRVGIVAAITDAIADRGGNITDLQTRLGGGLYVVVAEADFPREADASSLTEDLKEVGRTVGVDVSVLPADQDVL
ncbi:MAG: ACT domain-containing protein [Micrococcales bacterium]|nr:ACT domain-containing protein [Micrococcales bacterium]